MKTLLLLILPALTLSLPVSAQLEYIHNITVSQRADASGLVDVNFDIVAAPRNYYIYMEVSFDGGATYSPVMSNFTTGDTGPIGPGTGYQIVWDGLGSFPDVYSTQAKLKLTASVCPEQTMMDGDSNVYFTVGIGDQCWMKTNLNVGTMIAGASDQTDNSVVEKYCYDDVPANCAVYGGLYQWDELMQYVTTQGAQGLCPAGWHIPTDAEWTTLTTYLGGTDVAGGKMKEAGLTHWFSPNTGATNSSGFTALPGGSRNTSGNFSLFFHSAFFWSSMESSSSYAHFLGLNCVVPYTDQDISDKSSGKSVRCLQD